MEIKKVLNDGKNVTTNKIYTFLTVNGYRTPKEIYVGCDKFGTELHEITKKGLLSKIEMNNEVFTEHPELLNI